MKKKLDSRFRGNDGRVPVRRLRIYLLALEFSWLFSRVISMLLFLRPPYESHGGLVPGGGTIRQRNPISR
jgi:hypothetical protein